MRKNVFQDAYRRGSCPIGRRLASMPAPRLAANDSGMIQIKLKPKTPLNAMAMATAPPHAAPNKPRNGSRQTHVINLSVLPLLEPLHEIHGDDRAGGVYTGGKTRHGR